MSRMHIVRGLRDVASGAFRICIEWAVPSPPEDERDGFRNASESAAASDFELTQVGVKLTLHPPRSSRKILEGTAGKKEYLRDSPGPRVYTSEDI